MMYLTVGDNDTEQGSLHATDCHNNEVLAAVFGILGVFAGSFTGNTAITIGSGLVALAVASFIMPQCEVK